jgi:hypothetical protein
VVLRALEGPEGVDIASLALESDSDELQIADAELAIKNNADLLIASDSSLTAENVEFAADEPYFAFGIHSCEISPCVVKKTTESTVRRE